jgi:REP element-mobilizing transposase RayT
MPHSRYFLFYHIVFATKYREWFIDEGIEQAVWDILWEICVENTLCSEEDRVPLHSL